MSGTAIAQLSGIEVDLASTIANSMTTAVSKDASSNNLSSSVFTVALTGSTPAPAGTFSIKVGGQTFNSVFDPMMGWGYNFNSQSPPVVTTEPAWWWQMETNYADVPGNRKMESYLAYQPPTSVGSWQLRPMFVQADAVANTIVSVSHTAQTYAFNYDNGGGVSTQVFGIRQEAASATKTTVEVNPSATGNSLLNIIASAGANNARLGLTTGTNTSEIRTAGVSGASLQIQCASGGEIDIGPSGFSAPEVVITTTAVTLKNTISWYLGNNQIRAAGGSHEQLQIQCASAGGIQLGANAFSAPELKLGNAQIGFFNTLVSQQSAAGAATGYAAGTTAATFHSDDKYTGNTGTTGYTINGIVAALKNYGLLAA